MKQEIEDWQLYHELGHGIIAYILDGYLYHFKGITLKPSDIKKANLHEDDVGYTKIRTIDNFHDFSRANTHTAALVDGLYLLSGSAGATFFCRNADFTEDYLVPSDLNKFNYMGADGDFEIIKQAKTPFGLLLVEKKITRKNLVFTYCKIFQILKDLFSKPEILNAIESLFDTLKNRKELSVNDFENSLDVSMTHSLKLEILNSISVCEFGTID